MESLAAEPESTIASLPDRIAWALRLSACLQAIGVWRWFVMLRETPLLEWLHDPADVGGWGISEHPSLVVQQAIGWATLACGAWVLWRPQRAPAIALTAVQVLIAWAMTAVDEGFPVESAWAPVAALRAYPWLTNAARIGGPLALLRLGAKPQAEGGPTSGSSAQSDAGLTWLLRTAIAVTFFAHGVEALQHNPQFVDFLIDFSQRWLGADFEERSARSLLTVIGVADVAAAIACLSGRWRGVLWWMAAWGLVTALSRVAANGPFWWHEVAVRAPHYFLPAALAWLPRRVE